MILMRKNTKDVKNMKVMLTFFLNTHCQTIPTAQTVFGPLQWENVSFEAPEEV